MAGRYLDWDDLDLKKGDRVGFEKNGEIFFGVVKDIIEDEETNEIRIITE